MPDDHDPTLLSGLLGKTKQQSEENDWLAGQRGQMCQFRDPTQLSKWHDNDDGTYEWPDVDKAVLDDNARPESENKPHEWRRALHTVGKHLRFCVDGAKLLIVMTVYNEDKAKVEGSVEHIAAGVNHLVKELQHKGVPQEDIPTSQDIVLLIVCDGRAKMHASTKEYLAGLKLYDEDEGEYMALYQRAVWFPNAITTLQIMVAVKEDNAGKLDSHKFAFYSIATLLAPKALVLVDAGTKPAKKAIRRLYTELVRNPVVAGTCGEITVELTAASVGSALVYAQVFEYKVAHLLDKTLQRVVGYIDVLPGAFSAYRWSALCAHEGSDADTPLTHYFQPLEQSQSSGSGSGTGNTSPMAANKALAEDRTLCFWLYVHPSRRNILTYIHAARASTDVPDSLADFIKQRRRWINGSFFASLHTLSHATLIYRSKHGPLRRALFTLLMLYQVVILVLGWFTPALFYMGWFVLINTSQFASWAWALRVFWWCIAADTIIISMGNPVDKMDTAFKVVSVLFSALYMLAFFCGIHFVADHESQLVQVAGLVTLCAPVAVAALFGLRHLCFVLMGVFAYYVMLPVYTIVLQGYAMANIHDLSWGNRAGKIIGQAVRQAAAATDPVQAEAIAANAAETEAVFKRFRSHFVLAWIVCNGVALFALDYLFDVNSGDDDDSGPQYWDERDLLTVLLYGSAALSLVRVACAVLYIVGTRFDRYVCQPSVDWCTAV